MKYLHPRRFYRKAKVNLHDWFFYYFIPDEWEIRYRFRKELGYRCNLRNPQTFNEKTQWLKLHDHNPLYPLLTDKIGVKKIVARELGEEYIIPTLAGGVGFDRFDDIPFDTLPDQFVLKCNHDSHSIVICKDKNTLDYKYAKEYLERQLHRNYYHYKGKQWGYKDIKPQIFVEQYMENGEEGLNDYKFLMFGGECKYVYFLTDRLNGKGVKENCYDSKWNLLPFIHGNFSNTSEPIPCPTNYEEMLSVATRLAKIVDNSFVRIDLYNIKGKIYFGEFTLYSGGGFVGIYPKEWDYKLGEEINLAKV